jgi:hypothetical protein
MFSKAMRVAGLVAALSQALVAEAAACNSNVQPDNGLGTIISVGAIGTGVLVMGIALALRPAKPQPAVPEEGSTTTLPAS